MDPDMVNIHELIAQLNSNERLRQSSHFSQSVYRDEPIIITGKQMPNYLPERYRRMHEISRWQEGANGERGRWLSEAELFYRQARFLEDFEDDCPYHGRFASYYPTYNAMSDRQLRGYVTWRTAVRHGDVQQTSLSFTSVYLFELINGIGWTDPVDGFTKIRDFWQAYRVYDTSIDRNARVWLHDFAIYYGLDPELLTDDPVRKLDLELIDVAHAFEPFDPSLRTWLTGGPARDEVPGEPAEGQAGKRRRVPAPNLPLPPDETVEQAMFDAIDAHASYRVSNSRLYKERPDDFRHVLCAVFVRMLAYYRKNRKHGLVESSFGEEAEMGYTMFGSAVFYEEYQHADTDYLLDPIHRYRCRDGLWSCRRIYGGQGRSKDWGKIARAVDWKLREALEFTPSLKEPPCPKYLARIIDREIDTWLSWKREHAPRVIDIDLSKLTGIRAAAAETREALLVDEEREDVGAEGIGDPQEQGSTEGASEEHGDAASAPGETMPVQDKWVLEQDRREAPDEAAESRVPEQTAPLTSLQKQVGDDTSPATEQQPGATAQSSNLSPLLQPTEAPNPPSTPLNAAEQAYLQALVDGTTPTLPPGTSEDLLVDNINEKLFDLLGDTAVEFGPEGPHLIDDYRSDIQELIEP